MTSLSTDIKAILTAGGMTNIYRGDKPADTDNIIAIFQSGGYPRSMSGTKVEEPTFQIIVRNTGYDAGITVCDAVKNLLHAASTTRILMIQQQGDTLDLGKDQNNRHEFSLNFRCYYRR
jgi:hypothetical protein